MGMKLEHMCNDASQHKETRREACFVMLAHQHKYGYSRPFDEVRSPAEGDGQQQNIEQIAGEKMQQVARVGARRQQPCAGYRVPGSAHSLHAVVIAS